jgi:hypothetical protein
VNPAHPVLEVQHETYTRTSHGGCGFGVAGGGASGAVAGRWGKGIGGRRNAASHQDS